MFTPKFPSGRNRVYLFFVVPFLLISSVTHIVYAASQATDYLCEFGATFYRMGRYDDAVTEFKKVLLIDPGNKSAKKYLDDIFKSETGVPTRQQPVPLKSVSKDIAKMPAVEREVKSHLPAKSSVNIEPKVVKPAVTVFSSKVNRDKVMEEFLNKASNNDRVVNREKPVKEGVAPKVAEESKKSGSLEVAGIKVSGEVQLRLGATNDDFYWKRANWDLNEKNFRTISSTALDKRENTFDPRIYDRLRFDLDTENTEGFNFHSNIVVDPWSFTGKSDKFTVTGLGGDAAQFEFKSWGNTGYTINEVVNTLNDGDSIALPEVKVKDGRIDAFRVNTNWNGYNIPETKLETTFQPFRELWFDYNQGDTSLRLFPLAYENQAVTFDDPLVLSNNHIWWEDSPWIRRWKPGNLNWDLAPVDFTKGYWDKSVSFFARDSEGRRLTSLRGATFGADLPGETSVTASIASPKDPWQDYDKADNVLSALRLKHVFDNRFTLGFTSTNRLGFNSEQANALDARDFMYALDSGYQFIPGLLASAEVANSQSKQDLTLHDYARDNRGFAYLLSLTGCFPGRDILTTKYGYNGITPDEHDNSFTKFRLFAVRMDDSFVAPLSSYVETRDDESWGRHLHFRSPLKYYYQGEGQMLSWEDIKPFSIGNGIDVGRSTLGLRIESKAFDKRLENLIDVRNVHESNGGKFIENVARDEMTFDFTKRLTGKFLGIHHQLHDTHGGIDPFIFDTDTGSYFTNNQIEDGKNLSVNTGSLGAEYTFFDGLALNGIWEYTNDIYLGYDGFPRSILNAGGLTNVYYQEGKRYRDVANFLYNQQYFPNPPYPYYNIFKTGLRITPIKDRLEFYFDYTRNPYEKAGQVDDNMNHVGLEMAYTPMPKLSMFFKYTYSRWQDLDAISQGNTKLYGHHNAFAEVLYRISEDQDFSFQYGEASRDPFMGGVLDIGWDPYGGSLRTIDTQHIFRLYYRRKF